MGFKFKCLIRFDIGNGSTVRFWHDLWQVRSPLKERYPTLFLIERSSDATVAYYIEYGHG